MAHGSVTTSRNGTSHAVHVVLTVAVRMPVCSEIVIVPPEVVQGEPHVRRRLL
jgi:hypothetical protein